MGLEAGRRFGSFNVLSPLGVGGMGGCTRHGSLGPWRACYSLAEVD